jgi:hypothetical protein
MIVLRCSSFLLFTFRWFLFCWFLMHWFFYFSLKRTKRLSPELFEVLTQSFKPLGIELIETPVSRGTVHHEICLLQNAEVLRNSGPADRKLPRKLADGARPGDKAGEDVAAGGVAEGVKLQVLVSVH